MEGGHNPSEVRRRHPHMVHMIKRAVLDLDCYWLWRRTGGVAVIVIAPRGWAGGGVTESKTTGVFLMV